MFERTQSRLVKHNPLSDIIYRSIMVSPGNLHRVCWLVDGWYEPSFFHIHIIMLLITQSVTIRFLPYLEIDMGKRVAGQHDGPCVIIDDPLMSSLGGDIHTKGVFVVNEQKVPGSSPVQITLVWIYISVIPNCFINGLVVWKTVCSVVLYT